MNEESQLIENSIKKVLEKGYRTFDIMQDDCQLISTSKMGELIIFELDLLVGNK